jgi:hypothetical protein
MFRFLCNHINLFAARQAILEGFYKGIIKIGGLEKLVSSVDVRPSHRQKGGDGGFHFFFIKKTRDG